MKSGEKFNIFMAFEPYVNLCMYAFHVGEDNSKYSKGIRICLSIGVARLLRLRGQNLPSPKIFTKFTPNLYIFPKSSGSVGSNSMTLSFSVCVWWGGWGNL